MKKLTVSGGLGIHFIGLHFRSNTQTPERISYSAVLSPRLALGYPISEKLNSYINYAEGFSPPAAEEIFADNGVFNSGLKPERSKTLEAGIKGNIIEQIYTDLAIFTGGIGNSVVSRRDALGSNYYVNAGEAAQTGIEFNNEVELIKKASVFINKLFMNMGYTFHYFKYKKFEQEGSDFSGNYFPGVPKHHLTYSMNMEFAKSYFLQSQFFYTDKIFLNDANTTAAENFNTLMVKAGFNKQYPNFRLQIYAGVNNLADSRYSLGNDINAFSGRYYNVAPGRNFFAGLRIEQMH